MSNLQKLQQTYWVYLINAENLWSVHAWYKLPSNKIYISDFLNKTSTARLIFSVYKVQQ